LKETGATTMANGVIKKLISDKGFGFIEDRAGKQWFFTGARLVTSSIGCA
jgi:hypothetical protein